MTIRARSLAKRSVSTQTLAALLAAAPYSSAAPCSIELSGAPDADWRAAVEEARRKNPDDDCARIAVDVGPEHAVVSFETTDGRSARRIVQQPADLEATLSALRVTGTPFRAPEAPPPVRSNARDARRAAVTASPSDEAALRLPVAFLAGLRGGTDSFVTPIVSVAGALVWEGWTLGALLAFEPQYLDLARAFRTTELSTVGAQVTLGVRAPIGERLVLLEARAGAAAYVWGTTTETASVDMRGTRTITLETTRGDVEGRVGVALGWLSSPDRGSRLRVDLTLEVVPEGLSESTSAPASPFSTGVIESTPVWAIGAAVGLELDTL